MKVLIIFVILNHVESRYCYNSYINQDLSYLINHWHVSGDLRGELEKEKESQSTIRKKIEEETKTTGNILNFSTHKA